MTPEHFPIDRDRLELDHEISRIRGRRDRSQHLDGEACEIHADPEGLRVKKRRRVDDSRIRQCRALGFGQLQRTFPIVSERCADPGVHVGRRSPTRNRRFEGGGFWNGIIRRTRRRKHAETRGTRSRRQHLEWTHVHALPYRRRDCVRERHHAVPVHLMQDSVDDRQTHLLDSGGGNCPSQGLAPKATSEATIAGAASPPLSTRMHRTDEAPADLNYLAAASAFARLSAR